MTKLSQRAEVTVFNDNCFVHIDDETGSPVSNKIKVKNLSKIFGGKNLFVDGVNGNNSSALPYRIDKPYLTPEAALSVAVSGDTIVWLAGTYTPTANLYKSGVGHTTLGVVYINYATNIKLFDMSLAGVDEKISIQGQFIISAVSTQSIFYMSTPTDIDGINININIITAKNTNGNCGYFSNFDNDGLYNTRVNIKGNFTANGGYAVYSECHTILDGWFESFSTDAVYFTSAFYGTLQGHAVTLTGSYYAPTGAAVRNTVASNGTVTGTGVFIGMEALNNSNAGSTTITGSIKGNIFNINGVVNLFIGEYSGQNTAVTNRAIMNINCNTANQFSITQNTNATARLTLTGSFNLIGILVSAGVVYDYSFIKGSNSAPFVRLQTGGTYYHYGRIKAQLNYFADYIATGLFNLEGGTLYAMGIIENTGTFVNECCVAWYSGELIIDGGKFITNLGVDTYAIDNISSARNVRSIFAKQNKLTMFAARKQKATITIIGGAVTSTVHLNGTAYTSALATDVLRAAAIFALINADVPQPITATNLVGAIFDIEADVSGVPFTYNTPANVNATQVNTRFNCYLMTNVITGGILIEDAEII